VVRTPPVAISAVNRDPVGSSTPTSADSFALGPIHARRNLESVTVSRRSSKTTESSSAYVRAVARDDLDRAHLPVDGEADGGGGG
jgi:hypothetical protein